MPYEQVEYDVMKGETRRPEFLARNPNGRIPVLGDEKFLFESNALRATIVDNPGNNLRNPG